MNCFLFRGAYINQVTVSGLTPIMTAACFDGHLDIVKYLVERKAELDHKDKNDQTIIHLAAKNNQDEVIEEILQSASDDYMVNENDQFDNTPLHLASAAGYLETVKVLVKHNAQIDNKNEDEQTPLHMAANQGHSEVVEYIVQQDKNSVNDLDEDDNTALHLAAREKMTRTVEVLLEHGSDVRKRNGLDWTPLDCAAASGSYKCVQKILEAGADVDPMDRKRTTPLHLTAIHGHPQVAVLLLENGAKIEIENDEGKNALELAIDHGNRTVAEAILSSEHWRRAMETSNVSSDGLLNTPMRMLIKKFPELAAKVMDNCIAKIEEKDSQDLQFNFEFAFIEDTFNYKRETNVLPKDKGPEALSGSILLKKQRNSTFEYRPDNSNPYDSNSLVVQNNHPLMIMTKQKNKSLLKHPLCLALLR